MDPWLKNVDKTSDEPMGTLACSCRSKHGYQIWWGHQDCGYVPKLSTLKSTDFLQKRTVWENSETQWDTLIYRNVHDMHVARMNSAQKIWNTEPLWPCVSSCKLCRKTGSFCIFSMNSFFSWCSTTCALTQHVHRKTQKRRLFHQKMPNVLDIWQNMIRHICHISPTSNGSYKRHLWTWSLAAIIKPVSVEIGWQQTFPFLKQMEQIDGVQLINQSQRPWVLAFCLASLKLGRISSFSSRPGQPRWSVEGRRGRSRLPELTTHWETSVKFTAGWPNRMASPLAKATWILKRNIQTSMTFQHPTFKKK